MSTGFLNQPSGCVGIGAGQEADEVEAEDLLHEFVVERLSAAIACIQPSIWLARQPKAGGVPNSEKALFLPYQ